MDINKQPNLVTYSEIAKELLQKGIDFAENLSRFTVDHASRSTFDLGPALQEREGGSAGSRVFEIKNVGETLGEVVITYHDEATQKEIKSIQLLNKDRSKSMLLHEFTGSIRVKRGRLFAYNIATDSITTQKLTHLSDVLSLLHEFGHAYEDVELRILSVITLAKKILRDNITNSKAAKFVYLNEGSNYMELLRNLEGQLKRIFPGIDRDFLSDMQNPVSQNELDAIYSDEQNAHLYALERLVRILTFLDLPIESELSQRLLNEQASYAGVCLRTYRESEEDYLGFDPREAIKENHATILKFGIEAEDQTAEVV